MSNQPALDILGTYSLEVVRDLLQHWVDTNGRAQQIQATIPAEALPGVIVEGGNVWDVLVLPLVSVPTDELRFAQALLVNAVDTLDRLIDDPASLSPPERMIVDRSRDTTGGADVNEEDAARMAALQQQADDNDRTIAELRRTVAALEVRVSEAEAGTRGQSGAA